MLDMLTIFYPATKDKDKGSYTSTDPYQSKEIAKLLPCEVMLTVEEIDQIEKERVIWEVQYPLALEEMLSMGWCREGFDPYHKLEVDSHYACYTDTIGNQIKGFMIFRCCTDEIVIEMIYILPEYRGMGIGKKFIKTIMAEAISGGYPPNFGIVCDIYDHNESSIKMFEALGFKPASRNYRWVKELDNE